MQQTNIEETMTPETVTDKDFISELQLKIKRDVDQFELRNKQLEDVFDTVNSVKKNICNAIEETKSAMIMSNDNDKKVQAALNVFESIQKFLTELEASAAKQSKYQAGMTVAARSCNRFIVSHLNQDSNPRAAGERPEKLSDTRSK